MPAAGSSSAISRPSWLWTIRVGEGRRPRRAGGAEVGRCRVDLAAAKAGPDVLHGLGVEPPLEAACRRRPRSTRRRRQRCRWRRGSSGRGSTGRAARRAAGWRPGRGSARHRNSAAGGHPCGGRIVRPRHRAAQVRRLKCGGSSAAAQVRRLKSGGSSRGGAGTMRGAETSSHANPTDTRRRPGDRPATDARRPTGRDRPAVRRPRCRHRPGTAAGPRPSAGRRPQERRGGAR